jgi:hypothetical protein
MGGNDAQKAQSSGGGDMQSKLIGMAMAEAMKVSPFPSFFFRISHEIELRGPNLMLICVSVVIYSCSALPEVRPPTEVGNRMSSTLLESVSLCLFAVSLCQLPWKLTDRLLYMLMVRRS